MKACSFSGLRRGIPNVFAMVVVAVAALMAWSNPSSQAWAQSSAQPRPSSVSIRTPDFDESLRWYQDILGFRLITTQNFVQGRQAVLERSGSLLEVTEADHVLADAQDPHATGGFPVTAVPLISLLVSDVDEEVTRLRKAGVEILQEPQDQLDGRYRTAEIRDNGRHRIELREPLDEGGGFNPLGR